MFPDRIASRHTKLAPVNPTKPARPSPRPTPSKPAKAADPARAPSEVRIAAADFRAAASKPDQVPPPDRLEIAFAGRSNVGKSSLLNMLLARKGLARTSNTPGRTRQINFFDVDVAGGPKLCFVDLPGYGYAKVSKSESASWKQLLESYLQNRPTLRAVVLLVDVRRGVEEEERELIEFLGLRDDLEVLVVATKVDKLARNAMKPALLALGREAKLRVIGTSADTRLGREEVWARLLRFTATAGETEA